jgi:hypothetical protein
MQNKKIVVDYKLKFSANAIVQTERREWIGDNWDKPRKKQNANLKNNATRGLISQKSKSRLKKSINWLVMSAVKKKAFSLKTTNTFNFKVNFITLTIPPQENGLIEEKEFKSLINTWLTYHRTYSKLNNYVWKIEKHKDNRLHIHITTDTYIHYKKIKDSWNLILQRGGFLEYHFAKFGNYCPNSTDVHSIKKVKKLAAYLVKYMAKSNEEDPMYNGRVWSCSLKISKVVNNELIITPDCIGEVLRPLFNKEIEHKIIETEPNAMGRKFAVADLYLMRVKDWVRIKGTVIYDYFKELILFLRPDNYGYRQESLTLNIG